MAYVIFFFFCFSFFGLIFKNLFSLAYLDFPLPTKKHLFLLKLFLFTRPWKLFQEGGNFWFY